MQEEKAKRALLLLSVILIILNWQKNAVRDSISVFQSVLLAHSDVTQNQYSIPNFAIIHML